MQREKQLITYREQLLSIYIYILQNRHPNPSKYTAIIYQIFTENYKLIILIILVIFMQNFAIHVFSFFFFSFFGKCDNLQKFGR